MEEGGEKIRKMRKSVGKRLETKNGGKYRGETTAIKHWACENFKAAQERAWLDKGECKKKTEFLEIFYLKTKINN